MKKIGILGGLSPESTIEYYKVLVKEYKRLKGGIASPLVTIESLNLQIFSDMAKESEWDKAFFPPHQQVRCLSLSIPSNHQKRGAPCWIPQKRSIHHLTIPFYTSRDPFPSHAIQGSFQCMTG